MITFSLMGDISGTLREAMNSITMCVCVESVKNRWNSW